jgi:hypothetical protein
MDSYRQTEYYSETAKILNMGRKTVYAVGLVVKCCEMHLGMWKMLKRWGDQEKCKKET